MQAFWIILSSLLFATMSVLIKLAAADFSLVEIVFFRTLPGALLLFGFAKLRRLALFPRYSRIHLARNASGTIAMFLGFYATSKLALATASSLEYTSPLFLMLYVLLLTGHRPRHLEIVALIGGFAGVMVLLQPSLRDDQIVPFLAGLAAGSLAAIAYLQIGRLGRAGEPAWRIVFFHALTGLLVSLIALPFTSTTSTYSLTGVLELAGIGLAGLGAQFAMTRGYSQGPPAYAATLQYSTVAFAVIYGRVFWGDQLSWIGNAGLLLIVGSGILAVWSTSRAIDRKR